MPCNQWHFRLQPGPKVYNLPRWLQQKCPLAASQKKRKWLKTMSDDQKWKWQLEIDMSSTRVAHKKLCYHEEHSKFLIQHFSTTGLLQRSVLSKCLSLAKWQDYKKTLFLQTITMASQGNMLTNAGSLLSVSFMKDYYNFSISIIFNVILKTDLRYRQGQQCNCNYTRHLGTSKNCQV